MKIFIYYDKSHIHLKELINNLLLEFSHEIFEIPLINDLNELIEKVKDLLNNNKNSLSIILMNDYIEFSIKINKFEKIRCSPLLTKIEAKLTKEHNNSNILATSSNFIENNFLIDIIRTYITTPFSEIDRHKLRVDLIEKNFNI
jgi:ribose 5-phosphate isomerase B